MCVGLWVNNPQMAGVGQHSEMPHIHMFLAPTL